MGSLDWMKKEKDGVVGTIGSGLYSAVHCVRQIDIEKQVFLIFINIAVIITINVKTNILIVYYGLLALIRPFITITSCNKIGRVSSTYHYYRAVVYFCAFFEPHSVRSSALYS